MEIGSREFYKIFETNFLFPIVNTKLGRAVKMDWLSAFLFANVTGAGYFDNPSMQFSPKGTQKVLREAFQYHVVTGLFDGRNIFYSPSELIKRKPYLFKGEKYVIAMEYENEYQLQDKLQDDFDAILDAGGIPTDYILMRIDISKKGYGMEPFMEYLACESFKRQGYVVENQVPLAATVGSPDFGGYKNQSGKGFHINELSLIRVTKNTSLAENLTVSDVIVGEAKTSTTIMEKQLRKYMDTGLFSKGYELHPSKDQPSIKAFGLLNVRDEFKITVNEPTAHYNANPSDFSKEDYRLWVESYFKYLLVSNFTNEELQVIVQNKLKKRYKVPDDLLLFITESTIGEIIDKIKEVL